jgi:4-amino-4-deoxy-L-arabinose transferase-like glycosyltransferase
MDQTKRKPAVLIAFAAIMVFGAVLMFVNISGDSLWYDEIVYGGACETAFLGHRGHFGRRQPSPLYYLMLKPVCLVFGYSETALRAFSVLGVWRLPLSASARCAAPSGRGRAYSMRFLYF